MSTTEHIFEVAPSGRSKCRGCGKAIAKDRVRFGERLPNPFGDGDMTHWHHPLCAAHRRPDSLLATLGQYEAGPGEATLEALTEAAEGAVLFPRLQRLGVIEQASSGRARCRHCKELIAVEGWRIPLVFFNEDTYNTSGFIHAPCATDYCETDNTWAAVECFAGPFDSETQSDIRTALGLT